MKPLTVLSLFDGIACGYEALKRASIPVEKYYASEVDKNAIKIAKKNHPDIIHLGDVRDWHKWNIDDIDLILAGSPCTDLSIAGRQNGLSSDTLTEYNLRKMRGEAFTGQSYLFWEFMNILIFYNPEFFLLENVRMKKEFENIITNILRTEPVKIDSADFSAQSRKRLYWTNIPVSNWEPVNTTIEDVLLDEVDAKYIICPNRAVIICDNEAKSRKIAYIGTDSQGNRIYRIHNKAVTLCGNAGGLAAKTGAYALPCITPNRTSKRQNGRRFKPPGSKFFTLTATDTHGILTDHFIRKLHPIECERLQTLPENYTECEGISDNMRYKALGNGWTVEVIAHILGGIKNEIN